MTKADAGMCGIPLVVCVFFGLTAAGFGAGKVTLSPSHLYTVGIFLHCIMEDFRQALASCFWRAVDVTTICPSNFSGQMNDEPSRK